VCEPVKSPGAALHGTEIQQQIEALSTRDVQLWSIILVLLFVLFLGLVVVALPSVLPTKPSGFEAAGGRLLVALGVLVILFNLCIIRQKQIVTLTRRELVREFIFSERLESLSLVDPHTQCFNHQGFERLVPRELTRANRMGTPLSLMLLLCADLSSVEKRFGATERDRLVVEIAQLAKETFRGSDIVFHIHFGEFAVVMPDTSGHQAERARERLLSSVDQWNTLINSASEMALKCSIVQYSPGETVGDLILRARYSWNLDEARAHTNRAASGRPPQARETDAFR
jgi:diguanylate cyclase (GGDEF)-like protein